MTTPDVHLARADVDPRPDDGLSPDRTQALIDVKFAGAARPDGPAAADPAVAAFYLGMREADADLGRRAESRAVSGMHQLGATTAHELTVYAFSQTVALHQRALQTPDPAARARLFGARNAFAESYAQLSLRDVTHMDAADVADRLVEALGSGLADPGQLVQAAWATPFPIVLT